MEEQQYLSILRELLEKGVLKKNRTSNLGKHLFGRSMRFTLYKDGKRIIPLLNTKRVFIKNMTLELLWFIKGCTDSEVLHKQGCKIWDANGSKEFLKSRGLDHRRKGDLGPVYGFQWRHFGAKYVNCDTDYTGKGIDQLANVIEGIKKDPFGRRHIVMAWNPSQGDEMALPPCHMFFQFNVRPDEKDENKPKYLDCMLYQRSADFPLGVPFNIASYSMLTHMISHITSLIPGEFIHNMGDCHIYVNQIESTKTQLSRKILSDFPELQFIKMDEVKSIDDFTWENIRLVGYKPQDPIKFPFSL